MVGGRSGRHVHAKGVPDGFPARRDAAALALPRGTKVAWVRSVNGANLDVLILGGLDVLVVEATLARLRARA